MDPFSTDRLDEIFKESSRNPNYIGSRESKTLEFKESFSFGGLPEYARAMASFANTEGGYLVFGIADKPREPVGLDGDQFDAIDPAELTEGLNELLQPSLNWQHEVHEWRNTDFGLIYTFEQHRKPVIARKNKDPIKNGDILYRYRGRTQRIRYAELRNIIQSRVEIERKEWMELMQQIARIGTENVAVMDTDEGELHKGEGKVLIDDSILDEVEFMEEKSQALESGQAYVLAGNAHPVPVNAYKEKRIEVGEDIYRLRASDVCEKVEAQIDGQFRVQSEHLKAWRREEIRPSNKPDDLPFKNKYCEYKEAEDDYRYSDAWVEHLVDHYSDPDEYNRLQQLPIDPRQ